jgi:hypothetical protein
MNGCDRCQMQLYEYEDRVNGVWYFLFEHEFNCPVKSAPMRLPRLAAERRARSHASDPTNLKSEVGSDHSTEMGNSLTSTDANS